MSDDHIQLDIEGGIACVTVDNGDGINSFSAERMRRLTTIAQSLRGNTDVHAIVLTGKNNFGAGVDLKDPELWKTGNTRLQQRQVMALGPDLCAAWEALEQVTICAIEGFCIGGAMALAVACDWRVMGQSAYFSLPEVPLGMNMSWQSNPRIVALIGPARAKELVILGERCDAEKALRYGLVEDIVADGETIAWARARAEKVAALPPLSVRMSKQALNASATALNYTASFMDRDQFAFTAGSNDQKEALRAFREKRTPNFTGD